MQVTSTPCVAICRVDEVSGLCVGCGRSRTEVAAWVEMSEPDRLAVMAVLPQRFEEVTALAAARADFDADIAERIRARRGRRRAGDGEAIDH